MERIQVRLMNDYTVGWPLWTDTLTRESEWDLSPELIGRLKAWAATYNEHFHYERGWDGSGRCEEYRAEGLELHRLLAAELGPGYEVTVDVSEADD